MDTPKSSKTPKPDYRRRNRNRRRRPKGPAVPRAEIVRSTSPHCICQKPAELCMCDAATSRPIQTRLRVLIVQHPQEPDKELGTAPLLKAALPQAQIITTLSRASLAHALGLPKGEQVDPKRWAVLYLGAGAKTPIRTPIAFLSKKGETLGEHESPRLANLDGIVVLDGTWSQAKALWWRNAWLLKLWRIVLPPAQPSLYGKLRKEPRRECISTLESTARALVALGENPEVETQLLGLFQELLSKYKSDPKGV